MAHQKKSKAKEPEEYKEPEWPSIDVKRSKAKGLAAYDIEDEITMQFKGKVTGIREVYNEGNEKDDFTYTITPAECEIIHDSKKRHKAAMMGKGIDKETYEKTEKE